MLKLIADTWEYRGYKRMIVRIDMTSDDRRDIKRQQLRRLGGKQGTSSFLL
jgi:hypothetical protein